MRARIRYDTKFGFKITPETDVSRALEILSRALDQRVELEKSCFICDKAIGEEEKPDAAICQQCRSKEDAYSLYAMKFATLMEKP